MMMKPEFNGEKVKEKRKYHNAFGGNVVEIFYGARDTEGNAAEPKEGAEDGQGRWYGIDCNGEYTMFSWKHSAAEGGEVEYGTEFKDDALTVMEDQLRTKAELCRQAEDIARNYQGEDGQQKLDALKGEWDALKNWGTPKDAELEKRLERAFAEFAPRAEAIRENTTAKQAIIDRIPEVAALTNFKEAQAAAKKLWDELREIGSAGEDNDNAFANQVSELRKEISRKQKEYFANLDSVHETAKVKKAEIIEKAKNVLANVSNWKVAGDQLNNLFNDWKAAGSAGRDFDDTLWKEFNEVRDEFYAKRKQFFNERNAKFKKSIETKKNLIEEAKKIAAEEDYSRENTERMKKLDVEWRAAGYSGRDENDKLWDEFNEAKEVFWAGKKAIAVGRLQAELEEKEKKLESLNEQLSDLGYRIEIAETPAMKEGFEKDVYIKKSQINDLESEISALKDRIAG